MTQHYKNLDKYLLALNEYNTNPTITATQLAKKYQFDRASFSRWLKKNNVSSKGKQLYVSEETYKKQQYAAKDYVENMLTIGQAAKKYKISEKSFATFLNKNKLKRKTFIRRNDLSYNVHFFEDIDTEEKAYWLGFIFADGCISGRSKNDPNPNRLSIEISSIDENHLEKFKQALQSNVDIKNRTRHLLSNKDILFASLTHVNRTLVKPLLTYGAVINKTKNGFIDTDIFIDRPYLIRHFLRGYIDGDGWVNEKGIGLCVYSDKIFSNIKYLISKIFDSNSFVETRYETDTSHINRLCLYRQREQLMFTKLLYENCTVYLDRKYYKALENINRLTDNMATNMRNYVVNSAELTEKA